MVYVSVHFCDTGTKAKATRDVIKTRNGERGMGNREPGTGVWEQVYSGNPPENSEWRTKERKGIRNKRKCYGCKREFLPAVPPDDSNVLVGAQSDWHWDKQSMKSRLGRKCNRYSHKLPQSVRTVVLKENFKPSFVVSHLLTLRVSCHVIN